MFNWSSKLLQMSFCSSETSDALSTSRKGSWLVAKIDENEVDKEIEETIEDYQLRHPEADRMAQLDYALEYCREQLRELLTDEIYDKSTTKPIDISVPDGHGNLPTFMDIERKSARKQMFFDKIVHLGLEKQQMLDEAGTELDILRSEGHEFVLQPIRGKRNPCCEVCMHTIWRLVQSWRRCRVCGIRAHDKCAEEIRRVCAGVLASRPQFELNLSICDERSLAEQGYQCAECAAPICFEGPIEQEARLCDYSGELFCPNCHWNDTWTIPARIVHNLDATPRPVCRAVKQLLSIVERRPLIDMNESSMSLIKFHKELRRVSELRRNFLLMKCYFVSCRNAKRLRILQYLKDHSHFVDSATSYSLKELRELCEGKLLSELEQIHTVFRKHIEEECETCYGNGFYCELCDESSELKNKVLFPFTENTRTCQKCLAVFHKKCFERKSFNCPRCDRRRKREEIPSSRSISSSSEESSPQH
ncbi:unnamed protein product [Caenorhabditis bovis]|uniref:Phorbol-ester/DAG-type domain-containing protein n=1 Tax=Caenorhabditis bovis TaxID=2654633 RepID=A0A8S1EPD7_9PELO|nr:unnamed protein product [Caenorhabditis bovis]